MLRLFSRSPRKTRPVPLQRARLCVEMLEARSGPSALYDPLVIEPLDASSSLWYSTSEPAGSSTTASDPASAPPAGDTSGSTSSSGSTSTSTSPSTSTQSGSPEPASVGVGTDVTDLASTGGSGMITKDPSGGGQGSGSTLPPPPAPNQPPRIDPFTGTEAPGRAWTFAGMVQDESPGGLIVTFGGLQSLVGKTAVTAPNGAFSTVEILQASESGWATAQTVDAQGLASTIAKFYVTQTLP